MTTAHQENEPNEMLKQGLIRVLLGNGFTQVDDEFVNVSLLERSLLKESDD